MIGIRRSAAYRIAFTYSAALATSILLLGALVFFAADAAFRQQQDAALVEEASQLVADFHSEGPDDLLEAIRARAGGTGSASFGYALFDTHGRRVAGDLDLPQPPFGLHDVDFRTDHGLDPARALTTRLDADRTLVVAIDSDAVEQIDATILSLFAGAFVLVLVIGTAGALLLGGYLRRRLARISGTAQAIAGGNLERRVPVSPRGDEFDALAGTINRMLDRIGLLLEKLRQVSSDVAHDLRTPVSRLRTRLEGALQAPAGPADRSTMAAAIEQIDGILALFAGILRIAEVEGGAVAASFAPVDVSSLIGDIGEAFGPAVRDGGRPFSCEVEPDLAITGDRELLAQAIVNLIDNAQIHTPSGTAIILDAEGSDDWVRITVADRGLGVVAADRERIIQRFVRLDASRSAPGNGLGLNLTQAIVVAHGGSLVIGDNAPGLKVTVVLPRRPA